MRVLLTGATGFVGSALARILLRDGCEVQAIVRAGSDLKRISDLRSHLRLLQGDLLQLQALEAPLADFKPELCVHLGWFVEPGQYLNAPQNIEFLAATVNFASFLARIGCPRFVGVGTCFEYDTDAGLLNERTRLNPAFPYAAAKAGTYMLLKNLAPAPMDVAWARLFYLYGPFEDERRLVPSVIRALLRGEVAACTAGEQVRDFMHVDDAASALWAIARSSLVDAVNVGSGTPVTVAHLVTTIGDILGRHELVSLGSLPYAKADPPFVCADTRRLRNETSWKPRHTLVGGLTQTIDWWRTHMSSPSATAEKARVS